MEASKIEENRLRLKEKFGQTKLGGKGSQTRTHKVLIFILNSNRMFTRPLLIAILN